MNPGAELRALRPIKTYTCRQCGQAFTAIGARATYCSNACRQKVKYAKKIKHQMKAKP